MSDDFDLDAELAQVRERLTESLTGMAARYRSAPAAPLYRSPWPTPAPIADGVVVHHTGHSVEVSAQLTADGAMFRDALADILDPRPRYGPPAPPTYGPEPPTAADIGLALREHLAGDQLCLDLLDALLDALDDERDPCDY